MPEAKFGYRNEFSSRLLTGQNETQAVHGPTGCAYRISTASRSGVRTKLILTVCRRIFSQPEVGRNRASGEISMTSGDPLLSRPRVGVRRVLTTLTLSRFGGVRKRSPSTWC